MNKKEIAVSAAAALFLQTYANAAVVAMAEKKMIEIKQKAYGANWIDISDRVQAYLYYSTLIRTGKIKASQVDLPEVTDVEVKKYENFPWYNNPNWFKPYELATGLTYMAAGAAGYYSGNQRLKNIGTGVLVAGALDLAGALFKPSPKKFESIYSKSMKANPKKTYYGFTYKLKE